MCSFAYWMLATDATIILLIRFAGNKIAEKRERERAQKRAKKKKIKNAMEHKQNDD